MKRREKSEARSKRREARIKKKQEARERLGRSKKGEAIQTATTFYTFPSTSFSLSRV